MKFESKYGLGEIVSYTRYKNKVVVLDAMLEVIGVHFSVEGIGYYCRGTNNIVVHFAEEDLEGDPDFDQEAGCYPSGGGE